MFRNAYLYICICTCICMYFKVEQQTRNSLQALMSALQEIGKRACKLMGCLISTLN